MKTYILYGEDNEYWYGCYNSLTSRLSFSGWHESIKKALNSDPELRSASTYNTFEECKEVHTPNKIFFESTEKITTRTHPELLI